MSHPKRSTIALVSVALGVFAFAQKASAPKAQDKLAMGEKEIEQLLPLMDADKDGKVSRQEFMAFMQAEFERLDKDKSGKLDIKQLTQSKTPSSQFGKTGK